MMLSLAFVVWSDFYEESDQPRRASQPSVYSSKPVQARSASGRSRTCDMIFRKDRIYPLSYGSEK